jgi:predicted ribosome quality control (RQC) complex YloA/Tae2 family protein
LKAAKPDARKSVKFHTYQLSGGWTVLAGKNDQDNDWLTFKVAGPNDWWFHVRGMPGSHVILKGESGLEPDRGTLKQAAAVAGYHSKARSGGLTAVVGTRARFVKKPPGAKPGTVQVRKETVFKVRPMLPELEP